MLRFAWLARACTSVCAPTTRTRASPAPTSSWSPTAWAVRRRRGGSATTAYVVSALAATHPDDEPGSLLTRAVQEAHRQLEGGVVADLDRAGMATTLTASAGRPLRCCTSATPGATCCVTAA